MGYWSLSLEDTINIINENIKLLKTRLYDNPVSDLIDSVIVDGSYARGDFIEANSDIDLTVTVHDSADILKVKHRTQGIIRDLENCFQLGQNIINRYFMIFNGRILIQLLKLEEEAYPNGAMKIYRTGIPNYSCMHLT